MGEVVTLQPLPALAAGQAITLTLSAVWPAAPLTVTLTLEAAAGAPEITLANNQRQHRTDAIYLEVLVHPLVYAAFERRATLAGSWGFEDWMQAQVAALNDNLAASVYPAAPHGVPDRVRIDRMQVTDDTGGGTVTSDLEFDGRWTFRVDWNDPDTPEDEAALSADLRPPRLAAGSREVRCG